MPEDAPWADPVEVPDDIRDLQPDVDAYHRELRLARRRLRRQRIVASPLWQRWSFPVGVVTGAVALAAAIFVLLAVDGRAARAPLATPAPLAHSHLPAGTAGGLLPDLTVTTAAGTPLQARALRPSLVALLPAHCGCDPLLRTLADQAASLQLRLVVVAPTQPDAEVAALPGQIAFADAVPVYDSGGVLSTIYGAQGLTALVVGRDGVVTYVGKNVNESSRLALPLQTALLLPSSHR